MSIAYRVFHVFYKLAGHILCRCCRAFWCIRDKVNPPAEKSVLFVAHPDDDTLFFHSFIKKEHPYVVLLYTGWSLKRLFDFFKVMKYYGVRYRAYDDQSDQVKMPKLEKHIRSVLRCGNFELCATHNADGEYGHSTHQAVHNAVINCCTMPVLVPIDSENLKSFPLDEQTIQEKTVIFQTMYTTETFVLDQYAEWVTHERLIQNTLPKKS